MGLMDDPALSKYATPVVGAGSPAKQTGAIDSGTSTAQSAPQVLPPSRQDLASDPSLQQYTQPAPGAPPMQPSPMQGPGSSPQTAVPDTLPLSPYDKLALAAGNVNGSVNFLKQKFDDAILVPDKGIAVQKDGYWHAVPPELLGSGDAWDKTKALMRHVSDATPLGAIINVAKGQAKGPGEVLSNLAGDVASDAPLVAQGAAEATAGTLGAVGGPGGSIAAAGLAGFGSSALISSLGRLMGTFDATPEQQLVDNAKEGFWAMGGQSILLGAKPVISGLVDVGKSIGGKVSQAGADAISEIIGSSTKAGPPAIRALIDDASEVGMKLAKYTNGGGNTDAAVSAAAKDSNAITSNILETANNALPAKYKELLDGMLQKAGTKNVSVDFSQVVSDAGKGLEDVGLGKLMQDGKSLKFEPFSLLEQEARGRAGLAAENLDPELEKQIGKVVNRMTAFNVLGEVEGPIAAKKLVDMNKLLNSLTTDTFTSNESSAVVKQGVASMSDAIKTSIGKEFDKAGLSEEFGNMSKVYNEFGNAVKISRDVIAKDTGPQNLAKQLLAPAGKNEAQKDVRDKLVELINTTSAGLGDKMMSDLKYTNAAQNLIPWFPKAGIAQVATGATAVGSVVTAALLKGGALLNPVTAAMAAAAGTMGAMTSSPRVVAAEARGLQNMGGAASAVADSAVKYSNTALNWLKSLPSDQMSQFLGSDTAINTFGQIMATAVGKEQAMKNELVNRADAATQPHGMQIQQQGQQQPGQPQ